MELRFALEHPKPFINARQLLDAAREATIHTFGWPIGVVLERDEYRPRPVEDGIVAELAVPGQNYDYWSLRTNGDYYLLSSLFEDTHLERPGRLSFNTRIVRVTESLLFCGRLYEQLGIGRTSRVRLAVRHAGLAGREFSAVGGRMIFHTRRATVDASETEVRFALDELDSRLVDLVKAICSPLFMLFDFAEVGDPIYEEIIDAFVQGSVT